MTGKPAALIVALRELKQELAKLSLQSNGVKSCVAYFHQETAPLKPGILDALREQHITTIHHDSFELMGAVIGRDGAYIQQALSRFSLDMDPFFRRLLSEY